jgi:hypothetical protein
VFGLKVVSGRPQTSVYGQDNQRISASPNQALTGHMEIGFLGNNVFRPGVSKGFAISEISLVRLPLLPGATASMKPDAQ